MGSVNWRRVTFIAIIALAVFGQGMCEDPEATDTLILRSVVQEENTRPTTVTFWHLPAIGLTCSADRQTPVGRFLAAHDGQKVTLTLAPEPPLQKLVR